MGKLTAALYENAKENDPIIDLSQAEMEEVDERSRFYESSYIDISDGICQHTHNSFYPLDFCESCRPHIEQHQKVQRCGNKGKYMLRSGTNAWRDIIVCGNHKKQLLEPTGWIRHHKWRISEMAEIDKWIRELESRGFKVERAE